MRLLGYILSLVFLFTVVSCEVERPDYVVSPKKMEAFLYDYHLIQSMSSQYSSDDYKEKLYYSYIFKKHNIEKERFDSSMQWYNRYPKHLRRIYENLEARLEVEVEKLDESMKRIEDGIALNAESLAADTAELWAGSKLKMLLSTPLGCRVGFSFDVPSDTTFIKNDSLSFSFKAYFLHMEDSLLRQRAYASIRLDYADSTVFTNSVHVDTTGLYVLSAPRYPESKLKSMAGFVYYADNDTTVRSGMLLDEISVMRIHPLVENKN